VAIINSVQIKWRDTCAAGIAPLNNPHYSRHGRQPMAVIGCLYQKRMALAQQASFNLH
jgi:hypothetical protein